MTVFEAPAVLVGLSALFGYLNYRFTGLLHTVGMGVMAVAASLVLIAVALALSLPEIEHKASILTVTCAVVLLSIVVQGPAVRTLVQKAVRAA